MNSNSEIILQKQLIEGNVEAFEIYYLRYHQAVFKNIRKLIADQQESEDILQEVFITLWQKKHQLTIEHSIAGWLFSTSYFKSLEQLKKRVRSNIQELTKAHAELHFESFENINIEFDYTEKVKKLSLAIEQLPPQKKIAFTLSKLEGKSYEEVATTLNISVDTAREYVKAASKLLRQSISSNQLATNTLAIVAFAIFFEN